MHIILSKSTEEAIQMVLSMVFERVSSHPSSVIGLATGKTMEPVYDGWVHKAKAEGMKFEKTFFFMLDEYLDLDVRHKSSFRSYIEERLLGPLAMTESQFAFPPTHLPEDEAGSEYERLLKEAGGIDIQLLGIGTNGHIGFNEPGSDRNSRTRVVGLAKATINANSINFEPGKMPERALSMGIGNIMEAKQLVLLATGKSKADAIKYLFNHHDDTSCPATFLKSHPHFTLVLDPDAASKISLKI